MTQVKPIILIIVDVIQDNIKTKNAKIFLKTWIGYTILAWILAAALESISLLIIIGFFLAISSPMISLPLNLTEGVILYSGTIFGEVLGIMQWLVLRNYIPNASGWILATNLGYIIGCLMGISLYEMNFFTDSNFTNISNFTQILACIGFCLGLTQCFFLKRYSRYWREWIYWIPLTIICLNLVWICLHLIQIGNLFALFFGLVFLAISQGLIPGLFLIFLLRNYWRSI